MYPAFQRIRTIPGTLLIVTGVLAVATNVQGQSSDFWPYSWIARYDCIISQDKDLARCKNKKWSKKQKALERYERSKDFKAFAAASPWGAWASKYGVATPERAIERALEECSKYLRRGTSGPKCKVQAIGNVFVVDMTSAEQTVVIESYKQAKRDELQIEAEAARKAAEEVRARLGSEREDRRAAESLAIARMKPEQAREQAKIWRKELEEIDRMIEEANAEIKQTQKHGYLTSGLHAQLEAILELRSEVKEKFEAVSTRVKASVVAKETAKEPRVATGLVREQSATSDDSAEEARRAAEEKARREVEAKRLAEERAQVEAEVKAEERERQAAEAKPEAEKLRDQLDEARRLQRQAEVKRKEAEERAQELAEQTAQRDRVAAASDDQTQKQLESIRKQLEQLQQAARTTPQSGTTPMVFANRPSIEGRNYALIIGNNDYANLPDLKTAVADAAALSELLKLRYSFAPNDVKLLLNADRRTIFKELAVLRSRLKSDDRLLIYYAGHGEIDPATEEGFWQPVDAEVGERYTWIANDDIRREIRGLPAKHVLVVADSCFSGSLIRGAGEWREIPEDRFFTEIDAHVSRKVISSGGTEPVADSGSGGHSVFAYYLLKALRENDQPYIASFELFNRLARAVTNNSNQKPEYGTVADAGDEGSGDFTFILR